MLETQKNKKRILKKNLKQYAQFLLLPTEINDQIIIKTWRWINN